jgi:chromosome partitioning protein
MEVYMLILVGGQKGGTGKTTISVNLAVERTAENRDVLLLDIDPQLTSTLWASRRDENNISRIQSLQKVLDRKILSPGNVIRNEIKAQLEKYDDIIIDAGGADNEVLRAALTLADKVILPITPSELDMWTFSNLENLIANAQGRYSDLKGHVIVNKLSTNPGSAKNDLADVDDFLSDFEHLMRLKNCLYERKSIRKATAKGLAITEFRPCDDKATNEMLFFYKEVFSE